jgi:hypothetical protein
MARLQSVVACLITASFLASCSGGAQSPTPSIAQMPVRSKLPKFLQIGHTPPRPPARTHHITAAMRANAKKGGWSPVGGTAPFTGGADTELLMTDGTVMISDACTGNWCRLTPDSTGSYQTGSWSKAASLPSGYAPLYFASAILPDGKMIVNGGEYNFCQGAETTLGAIYDPVANSWTSVTGPSGWSRIGDGQSVVLNNGTYMLGNCCTSVQALYNEGSSSWTQVGTGKNDANSEEGWTLLRTGNLIVADVLSAPASELYNASSSSWSSAGNLPQNLTQSDEIGPQVMMPDNKVFVIGANGYTAIYDANGGKWSKGPMMPKNSSGGQLDIADGPATVLPDGSVVAAASPGVYSSPATFVIYKGGKKIEPFATPASAVNDSSYNIRLLMLPTGQILETDDSNDVEIYNGKTSALAGIAPKVTSVSTTLQTNSTNTISGKNFNGFTQDNFYGDDDQQAENFPLVRITNNSSGVVSYARTSNFKSMAIGSKATTSASFTLSPDTPTGASTLEVVTNGISSKPVKVTITGTK